MLPRWLSFLIGADVRRPQSAGNPSQATDAATLRSVEDALGQARQARKSGDLATAERLLVAALARHPEHVDTLFELARLLKQRGNDEDALNCLEKINGGAQDHTEALRLGVEYSRRFGKWQQAVDWMTRVARLDGAPIGDWYKLAQLVRQCQQPLQSLELIAEGMKRFPDDAHLLIERGMALRDLDRYAEAEADIARAHESLPDDADANFAYASLLSDTDRETEALGLASRFAAEHPENLRAQLCHASTLKGCDQQPAAVAVYERAALRFPDRAEPWINLAHIYPKAGDFEGAVIAGRHAVTLAPNEAYAHVNLAMNLLASGRLGEAWPHYQWRYLASIHQNYPVPPCPGNPLVRFPTDLLPLEFSGRRIALIEDQGLGDELSFLRFAPMLRQRGALVTYVPDPRLASLVDRSGAVDQVTAIGDKAPPDTEIYLAPGDLPLMLDVAMTEQIPPPLKLSVRADKALEIGELLAPLRESGKPLIGVTWRAGIQSMRGNRLFKTVMIEALAHMLRELPVEVIVLQRAPQAGEIEKLAELLGRTVHDFSDLNDDLEGMLALVDVLDDYVTVSNTNIHLRAGTGKIAHVLVPSPPDYRWMTTGPTSPWFPDFVVYREQTDGDWSAAFSSLTDDLHHRYGGEPAVGPSPAPSRAAAITTARQPAKDTGAASPDPRVEAAEYSRANPSPRYIALSRLYRQMHEEGERFLGIPAELTFAGQSLLPQATRIKRLIERTAAQTIIDYGSGKGKQYEARNLAIPGLGSQTSVRDYWNVKEIHCYDPSYAPFSELPTSPSDGVIATDVLEHCPEEDIPWIIDEMFSLAGKFVFANVACYPAKKRLSSGENAHCTIKPASWWASLLNSKTANHQNVAWEFWIQYRNPDSGEMIEQCLRSD